MARLLLVLAFLLLPAISAQPSSSTSATASATRSSDPTSSASSSASASATISASAPPSLSISVSPGALPSISGTPSPSSSVTGSPTASPSTVASFSGTTTPTPSSSASPGAAASGTASISASALGAPSASGTIAPSESPSSSVSLTGSVFGSSSATPSATPSLSLSGSVSATATPSPVSASASPSPSPSAAVSVSATPALRVASASLALTETADWSCVYGSPAWCDPLGSTNATLTIVGGALAAICSSPALFSWTNAPSYASQTQCSDTAVSAVFDALADPLTLLWLGGNLSGMVGVRLASAAIAPPPEPAQFARSSRLLYAWGDVVYVNGFGLGLLNATSAKVNCFVTGGVGNKSMIPCSPVPSTPCLQLFSVNASSVGCTLRFYSGAWALPGRLLSLSLLVVVNGTAGGAAAQPTLRWLDLRNATFGLAPPALNGPGIIVSASGYLPNAPVVSGGVVVNVTLPEPAWTKEELLNASIGGLSTKGLGVTLLVVDGVAGPSPCFIPDESAPLAMQCPAPAGHGVGRPSSLSLSGLANLTLSGGLSFDPPTLSSISPSWYELPQPGGNGDETANFSITFSSSSTSIVSDLQSLLIFTVGGVPCGSLSYFAVSTVGLMYSGGVRCTAWNAAAGAAAVADSSALDAPLMLISFSWAGALKIDTLSGSVFVVRPTLSSLTPTTVSANDNIVLFGYNFCTPGPSGCPAGAGSAIAIFIGGDTGPRKLCSSPNLITDKVATCKFPFFGSEDPGYPKFNVFFVNGANASSRSNESTTVVSFVATGTIVNVSALPTSFIPSDRSLPGRGFPLSQNISVRVFLPAPNDNVPFGGRYSCGITALGYDTLVLPMTLNDVSNGVVAAGPDNVVDFGSIGIQAYFSDFGTSNPIVQLSISCDAGPNNPAFSPLLFTVISPPLRIGFCTPPLRSNKSQAVLPPWSVALAWRPSDDPEAVCAASGGGENMLWDGPELPSPIVCTVAIYSPFGSSGEDASVQGTSATFDDESGIATFVSTSVGGRVGAFINLSTRCAIGAISIPPVLYSVFEIEGCAVGTQPNGFRCDACPPNTYSTGGSSNCTACPAAGGATCVGGVLQLLPGFFRPVQERGLPIDGSSQLLPCYYPFGCFVNMSAPPQNAHACAEGYTDILCAVCDRVADYAVIADACVKCLPSAANSGTIAAGIFLLLILVGFTVRERKKLNSATGMNSAIALRILTGHLQMLGALRFYKLGGSLLFRDASTWSELLSPSIFSEGPAQCAFHPSYTAIFFTLLVAPLIASAASLAMMVFFIAMNALYAYLCGRRMNSLEMSIRLDLQARWAAGGHIGILLFVINLTYMPVVGASLRVFNCTPAIYGIKYLSSDVRQECDGPIYTAVVVFAALMIVGFGVGYPVAIYVFFTRIDKETLRKDTFEAAWGFLYSGYKSGQDAGRPALVTQRTFDDAGFSSPPHIDDSPAHTISIDEYSSPPTAPASSVHATTTIASPLSTALPPPPTTAALDAVSDAQLGRRGSIATPHTRAHRTSVAAYVEEISGSRVWWEAPILLRKAGVVLIGNVVPDGTVQIAAVSLWIVVSLSLHVRFAPYKTPMFNWTEAFSLLTIEFTAILSFLTADPTDTASTRAKASSGIMLFLNFFCVLVLLYSLIIVAVVPRVRAAYIWCCLSGVVSRRPSSKRIRSFAANSHVSKRLSQLQQQQTGVTDGAVEDGEEEMTVINAAGPRRYALPEPPVFAVPAAKRGTLRVLSSAQPASSSDADQEQRKRRVAGLQREDTERELGGTNPLHLVLPPNPPPPVPLVEQGKSSRVLFELPVRKTAGRLSSKKILLVSSTAPDDSNAQFFRPPSEAFEPESSLGVLVEPIRAPLPLLPSAPSLPTRAPSDDSDSIPRQPPLVVEFGPKPAPREAPFSSRPAPSEEVPAILTLPLAPSSNIEVPLGQQSSMLYVDQRAVLPALESPREVLTFPPLPPFLPSSAPRDATSDVPSVEQPPLASESSLAHPTVEPRGSLLLLSPSPPPLVSRTSSSDEPRTTIEALEPGEASLSLLPPFLPSPAPSDDSDAPPSQQPSVVTLEPSQAPSDRKDASLAEPSEAPALVSDGWDDDDGAF